MLAIRWNTDKREYEPYEIPDNWHVPLWTSNMDETVNCAACGREVKFGNCYVSLETHNHAGLGYGICKECHDKEWGRKNG